VAPVVSDFEHAYIFETLTSFLLGFTDRFVVALWPTQTFCAGLVVPGDTFRVYLESILRRSRATYHTLLAAFNYLALLRSSMEQQHQVAHHLVVPGTLQPLTCQRRMFLSALMLGWKFTQEHCYSTRTWAKISGLGSTEINANEAAFLSVINWRLYIPRAVFESWATELPYYMRKPEAAIPNSLLEGY
jgi:hypothetical protein